MIPQAGDTDDVPLLLTTFGNEEYDSVCLEIKIAVLDVSRTDFSICCLEAKAS